MNHRIRVEPTDNMGVFSEDGPLVTAVLVTGKSIERVPLVRNAILSFLSQTHRNRALVVINDGDFEIDAGNAPWSKRIREIRVARGLTLGELRNRGLEAVEPNGIWVQWDDDDWRHPRSLEDQFTFLKSHDLDGCTLMGQLKYNVAENSAWEHLLPAGFKGFAGTIMAKNLGGTSYPAMPAHEDSSFWSQFMARHRVAAFNAPSYHYLRLIHSDNTSLHLRGRSEGRDQWLLDEESEAYLVSVLRHYGINQAVIDRRCRARRCPLVEP